jgi:signal transduction histidine kinase
MLKVVDRIKIFFSAPVADLNAGLDVPTADAHALLQLENDRRRLQYLNFLSGVWLVLGVVSLLSFPIYPVWQVSVTLAIGTGSAFLLVRSLLRQKLLQAACIAFCAIVDLIFVAVFLVLCDLQGPVEAFRIYLPVLMLMGITALLAGALIGQRAAFAVAAINTVVIVGLRLWLAPESDPRPSAVVFGWLLAGISYAYERTLHDVFTKLRDIRLGLESAVKQRTSELSNTVTQLQSTTQQLLVANHDLEMFCTSVAHDLRGPLLAIEGYSRLLQEEGIAATNPRAADLLQRMLQVEARMSRLIESLLSFARLGHHRSQRQRIGMTDYVRRIANELQAAEPARDLVIDVEPLPDCIADPVLIEQVIANLLANAIKFTRPVQKARVTVRGRIDGGEAVYSVQDNGVGFSMRDIGKLFVALQRLHPHSEFEGTGIGLAAIHRIVDRHGGRVWARGEPNAGAEFSFTIPLGNAHGEEPVTRSVESTSPSTLSIAK